MKEERIEKLLIAKDDFPLEEIIGRPITNFIRRFIHGSHYECHTCYETRKGITVAHEIKGRVTSLLNRRSHPSL